MASKEPILRSAYITPTKDSGSFEKPIIGLTEVQEERGMWARYKVISQSVSGTGDLNILCGFSPKLVIASVQSSDQASEGKTDFETTFSIRSYWTGTAFATSASSNLVSLSNLTGNITRRLYNGFIFNTSSFSGGAKTIYFTCFS